MADRTSSAATTDCPACDDSTCTHREGCILDEAFDKADARSAATPSRENQATTTTEATMDDECIRELREAVEKVKSLDRAVELPYWDDWSVTLAEGVEKLLTVAQPWFELREKAEALRDSVPPNSEAAKLAQEQIDFIDDQLRRLDAR